MLAWSLISLRRYPPTLEIIIDGLPVVITTEQSKAIFLLFFCIELLFYKRRNNSMQDFLLCKLL